MHKTTRNVELKKAMENYNPQEIEFDQKIVKGGAPAVDALRRQPPPNVKQSDWEAHRSVDQAAGYRSQYAYRGTLHRGRYTCYNDKGQASGHIAGRPREKAKSKAYRLDVTKVLPVLKTDPRWAELLTQVGSRSDMGSGSGTGAGVARAGVIARVGVIVGMNRGSSPTWASKKVAAFDFTDELYNTYFPYSTYFGGRNCSTSAANKDSKQGHTENGSIESFPSNGKLLENKLESMMILENKLESLKLLENKLESMKILENELESLKLQENQPGDGLVPLSIKKNYIRKCLREAVKEYS
ncbi:hypothetical protein Tco_0199293 [Tanacetum coccineum]